MRLCAPDAAAANGGGGAASSHLCSHLCSRLCSHPSSHQQQQRHPSVCVPQAPRGDIPREFFDACEPVTTDGEPVAWPRGALPPPHLCYFCFPAGLLGRLCAGGNDAIRHTFSFTEQV